VRRALLLCLLCVVAAGFAAAASTAARATTHSLTLHLVEKDLGFNFVDNPPRGGPNDPPTIGDAFAFTSNLLTRGGAHAGHLEATCTVTRGGKNGFGTCVGVLALAGGQLSVVALASLASNAPVTAIAIVGGIFSDDTLHVILP